MNGGKSFQDKFTALRKQAEQLIEADESAEEGVSSEYIKVLIHELQTHQIELELQNNDLRQTQEALNKSRKKFSDLYDFAPVGYLTVSQSGLITEANLRCAELLGIERGKLINTRFSAFINNEEQDVYYTFRKTLLSQKNAQTCTLRMQKQKGELFYAQLKSSYSEALDSQAEQFRIAIIDIDAQKKADALIKILSQAIEQSPVTVMITDTTAKIEYVNHAFEEISGYQAHEVIGRNPRLLQSGNTPKEEYIEMWQCINRGDAWEGIFQNRKKNGELYWEHVHIAPVFDASGMTSHYLAIKQDMTKHQQQEELIQHQAQYDFLTDLPNRFLALDRLSQYINDAKRNNEYVALLFLDLDDFKKVNDSMGHHLGDRLLIEVANRLQDSLRSSDTIGRFGGDEFIIVVAGLQKSADVLPVLETILEQSRQIYNIEDRELLITVSIGIAMFPEDGKDSQTLLKNVDIAMYHAKNLGRNTYSFFTDAMNREAARRLSIEEQMHGALTRNEFQVFYQPIIDIQNGKMIGAEALLRWQNSVLGDISPEEFIPIAEQTGQIVPIGEFVLRQALEVTAYCQQHYKPEFRIAVNISPRQFRDTNLLECIKNGLNDFNISNGTLALEVTEGIMLNSFSGVEETLNAIHHLGVRISMDDFGTGYSSLNYLRVYPFDVLKIDRSFIRDLSSDIKDRQLVIAAIAMGKSLGLNIVAEGVETKAQFDYLKQLNCDYAQGYFFDKPMPAIELTALLDRAGLT